MWVCERAHLRSCSPRGPDESETALAYRKVPGTVQERSRKGLGKVEERSRKGLGKVWERSGKGLGKVSLDGQTPRWTEVRREEL